MDLYEYLKEIDSGFCVININKKYILFRGFTMCFDFEKSVEQNLMDMELYHISRLKFNYFLPEYVKTYKEFISILEGFIRKEKIVNLNL